MHVESRVNIIWLIDSFHYETPLKMPHRAIHGLGGDGILETVTQASNNYPLIMALFITSMIMIKVVVPQLASRHHLIVLFIFHKLAFVYKIIIG